MQKFDYIVVGSGLAGLYAAYKASFKGNVAVITKSFVRESNSFNAQGGIVLLDSQKISQQMILLLCLSRLLSFVWKLV